MPKLTELDKIKIGYRFNVFNENNQKIGEIEVISTERNTSEGRLLKPSSEKIRKGYQVKLEEMEVTVKSDPEGAIIYINDVKREEETPAKIKVPAGRCKIKLVSKDGIIEEIRNAKPEEDEWNYRKDDWNRILIPNQARLEVISIPKGRVFIDGRYRGTTEDEITLPQGEYQVSIRREGCPDWEEKIKIKPPKKERINLALDMSKIRMKFPIINLLPNQTIDFRFGLENNFYIKKLKSTVNLNLFCMGMEAGIFWIISKNTTLSIYSSLSKSILGESFWPGIREEVEGAKYEEGEETNNIYFPWVRVSHWINKYFWLELDISRVKRTEKSYFFKIRDTNVSGQISKMKGGGYEFGIGGRYTAKLLRIFGKDVFLGLDYKYLSNKLKSWEYSGNIPMGEPKSNWAQSISFSIISFSIIQLF